MIIRRCVRTISSRLVSHMSWFAVRDSENSKTVFKETGDKDVGEAQWREILTPTQFKVLRMKATEPRRGFFDEFNKKGKYICAGCKTDLYESWMKFECGCGWPGFFTNIPGAVTEKADKDGSRIEITCTACRAHLGHIFRGEGFKNPPPNERHCVNSVSLAFVPENGGETVHCTYSGPVSL